MNDQLQGQCLACCMKMESPCNLASWHMLHLILMNTRQQHLDIDKPHLLLSLQTVSADALLLQVMTFHTPHSMYALPAGTQKVACVCMCLCIHAGASINHCQAVAVTHSVFIAVPFCKRCAGCPQAGWWTPLFRVICLEETTHMGCRAALCCTYQ